MTKTEYLDEAIRTHTLLKGQLEWKITGHDISRQEEAKAKELILQLGLKLRRLQDQRDLLEADLRNLRAPTPEQVDEISELSGKVDDSISASARFRAFLTLATTLANLVSELRPGNNRARKAMTVAISEDASDDYAQETVSRSGFVPPPNGRQAESLKDLLLIRHANRDVIDRINGNLGSALGRKKSSDPTHPDNGKPAILIFVPQKIAPKWLPPDQAIPSHLEGPNGVYCPVDVVEGRKSEDYSLVVDFGGGNTGAISWSSLRGLPPLTSTQLAVRERLRGWGDTVSAGAQLSVQTNAESWFGTLSCFVRHNLTGEMGLLTNQHVAGDPGQILRYASFSGKKLAKTIETKEYVTDEARFRNLIDERNAFFRVDCAYAQLEPDVSEQDLDLRVPVLSSNGVFQMLPMGAPLPLDLDTMGPIGRRVIGSGRTRSFQRGTIVAFAYEWVDEANASLFTDYLIVGDDPDQFSAPGDSGKLILTDEPVPRPVALLWGGWIEDLSNEKEQQDWTYAIDVNFVLDQLGVSILR